MPFRSEQPCTSDRFEPTKKSWLFIPAMATIGVPPAIAISEAWVAVAAARAAPVITSVATCAPFWKYRTDGFCRPTFLK